MSNGEQKKDISCFCRDDGYKRPPTDQVYSVTISGKKYDAATNGRIACFSPNSKSDFPDADNHYAGLLSAVDIDYLESMPAFEIPEIKIVADIQKNAKCENSECVDGKVMHDCGCDLCEYNGEMVECPDCNGKAIDTTTDEALSDIKYTAKIIEIGRGKSFIAFDGWYFEAIRRFTRSPYCKIYIHDKMAIIASPTGLIFIIMGLSHDGTGNTIDGYSTSLEMTMLVLGDVVKKARERGE